MSEIDLLTEQQTAERLTITVSTLRAWRFKGCGPSYHKIGGAVRYSLADLAEFLQASKRI